MHGPHSDDTRGLRTRDHPVSWCTVGVHHGDIVDFEGYDHCERGGYDVGFGSAARVHRHRS